MKTIFDKQEQQEFLKRIEKLTPETQNQWGKMNVAQMLSHCAIAMKMPSGEFSPALSPMRVIGQFFKKAALGAKPFHKNSPTAKELVMTDPKEFAKEKAALLDSFHKLVQGGEEKATAKMHPFFGKMSPAEWGQINYKHLDHHLRQFGV